MFFLADKRSMLLERALLNDTVVEDYNCQATVSHNADNEDRFLGKDSTLTQSKIEALRLRSQDLPLSAAQASNANASLKPELQHDEVCIMFSLITNLRLHFKML